MASLGETIDRAGDWTSRECDSSSRGRAMRTRKQCAFCNSTTAKISNEHAWPNWIRPILPPTVSTIIGTRPPNKPIVFPGRHDDMSLKVNTVGFGIFTSSAVLMLTS